MFIFPGYDDIKTWYGFGFWTDEMVKEAVKCNVISEFQYKDITGKDLTA